MILRTLALLVGVPLLLIGLLATVIAVRMVGNPGLQGGPPLITAQVIIVVLLAGVTITGAALCWLGVRKRSQRAAADISPSSKRVSAAESDAVAPQWEPTGGSTTPAYSSGSVATATSSASVAILQPPTAQHESFGYAQDPGDFDEHLSPEVDSWSPGDDDQTAFQIGTTGRLIGKSGPKMSGQLHYYVMGGLSITVGIAVMIWPQVAPGAADPATASKVGLWLGGGLMLFGGALIALKLCQSPQIVSLYDDRLEEDSGSKLRTIPLGQIARLQLQEFYEHRFAPQTFLVTVHMIGDRKLKFSTALGGDADLIVRCLADIATDVEVREFIA
jgi:hypothetical protein